MNILVIANAAFSPANVIGAIRWTKICKYLSMNGNTITVFAKKIPSVLHDNTLLNDVKYCNNIQYFGDGFTIRIIEKIMTAILKKTGKSNEQIEKEVFFFVINRNLLKFINSIFYSFQCKHYLKKNRLVFDIIISTNPLDAHMGAKKVVNLLHKPWIADFRDPLVSLDGNLTLYRRWVKRKQDMICRDADAIVTVSNGLRDVLVNDSKAASDKIHVIYNGYDETDRPIEISSPVDKKFHFVYTGVLYNGKRDLTPLFKSLRILCNEGIIQEKDLVFDYAGLDFKILKNQAEAANMIGILNDHGFVSRSDSLILQEAANMLVMATYNDEGNPGVMPGKLYEYMIFKKPILAIVSGNVQGSELKEVINDSNTGFCYESNFDDPKLLKHFLKYMLYDKDKIRFTYKTKRFEYINIAEEVDALLRKVKKENKN